MMLKDPADKILSYLGESMRIKTEEELSDELDDLT